MSDGESAGKPRAETADSDDTSGTPEVMDPVEPEAVSDHDTSLFKAIESGDRHAVAQKLSEMSPDALTKALVEQKPVTSETDPLSRTATVPLLYTADCGDGDVFLEVYRAVEDNLTHEATIEMLTSTSDASGRNLLGIAIDCGSIDVIHALAQVLKKMKLTPDQRSELLLVASGEEARTAIMAAARTSREEVVRALAKVFEAVWGSPDEQCVWTVTARTERGWTGLTFAVSTGNAKVVDAIVDIVERYIPPEQVNPFIEESLQIAISNIVEPADGVALEGGLEVLSCLLKHGLWPSPKQLAQVCSAVSYTDARKCFLDAVCMAINPLLIGMTLSLQLSGAAGMGTEGQRRAAARLQQQVEELVLEVFERLPQTVDGFEGGMKACCVIFAPEHVRGSSHQSRYHHFEEGGNRVTMGPLKIAVQARHQLELFCTQPLVLDFMSRKFSSLPSISANEAQMREADEVQRYQRETLDGQSDEGGIGWALGGELSAILVGPADDFGSLTILPGAQFILAQLATRPSFCYSIPAIRMGMYLIVYLSMLLLFGSHVLLFHEAVTVGEVTFFVYTLGAILIELMELWDGREEYMRDHWNVLDVLALIFCLAAFMVRVSDTESLWGRTLYCAGAPLLLFRTLFFAQFLPAQGPMIEIIFDLAGELARFGTIMLVVMVGFALSFYSLFRHSCSVDAFRTYWETYISLLRAMLGETQLFDAFTVDIGCCDDSIAPDDELHCQDFLMDCCYNVADEHFNGLVGKALLVAYLTLMGIILLNLLIAVLSEAYVDVKENINTESKVSRTLVIQHYVKAVEEDMLPSPLNLIQYSFAVVAMAFGALTNKEGYFRRAEYFAGLSLFWLVSGVFAVSVGSLLWLISWPKGIMRFWKRRAEAGALEMSFLTQAAILCCGVTMPVFILYKWVWATTCGPLLGRLFGVWTNNGRTGYNEIGIGGDQHDDGLIGAALKISPGGLSVQQLREFLANPMDDPVVQRDEETRDTTVEHLKLLRDRLLKRMEANRNEQVFGMNVMRDHLGSIITEAVEGLETATSEKLANSRAEMENRTEAIVDDRVSALSQKIAELDQKVAKILRAVAPDG